MRAVASVVHGFLQPWVGMVYLIESVRSTSWCRYCICVGVITVHVFVSVQSTFWDSLCSGIRTTYVVIFSRSLMAVPPVQVERSLKRQQVSGYFLLLVLTSVCVFGST